MHGQVVEEQAGQDLIERSVRIEGHPWLDRNSKPACTHQGQEMRREGF